MVSGPGGVKGSEAVDAVPRTRADEKRHWIIPCTSNLKGWGVRTELFRETGDMERLDAIHEDDENTRPGEENEIFRQLESVVIS